MVEAAEQKSSTLISIHTGALSNIIGSCLLSLEASQIYDFDDPVNHSGLFSNIEKRKARAIFYGEKFNFDLLQFTNSIPKSKLNNESDLSMLW